MSYLLVSNHNVGKQLPECEILKSDAKLAEVSIQQTKQEARPWSSTTHRLAETSADTRVFISQAPSALPEYNVRTCVREIVPVAGSGPIDLLTYSG